MERWTPERILEVLDSAAKNFFFPMLDNGYVYLAVARLSAYASSEDWALVIEVFGYSPREGIPSTSVYMFGSTIKDHTPAPNGLQSKPETYEAYVRDHAHYDWSAAYPITGGDCNLADASVAHDATFIEIRGRRLPIPSPVDYARAGVELSQPPSIQLFELCRVIADRHRQEVLASLSERRAHVPDHLTEVLLLDEWHHPDLASGVLPSVTESFQQLARVLAHGDASHYRPTVPPNTHWRHWPEGGSL